jgi:hypothetical protein
MTLLHDREEGQSVERGVGSWDDGGRGSLSSGMVSGCFRAELGRLGGGRGESGSSA